MKYCRLFAFALLIANTENVLGMLSPPSFLSTNQGSLRLTIESPAPQFLGSTLYSPLSFVSSVNSFPNSPDFSISATISSNPDTGIPTPTSSNSPISLENVLAIGTDSSFHSPGTTLPHFPGFPMLPLPQGSTSPFDILLGSSVSFDSLLPTHPFPSPIELMELKDQMRELQLQIEELEAERQLLQETLRRERQENQKRSESKNRTLKEKEQIIKKQQVIIDNQNATVRRLQQQNNELRKKATFRSKVQKTQKNDASVLGIQKSLVTKKLSKKS